MAAQPHVSQRLRRKIRLEQLAVGEHRETALIRADLDARAIDQLGVVMMSSRMPKTRAALMARRFPPPWTVEEQDAYVRREGLRQTLQSCGRCCASLD